MVTGELAAGWAGNLSGVVAGQGINAFLDRQFARCVEEQRLAPGVPGKAHGTLL